MTIQPDELRDLAERCEQLADEVDAGRGASEVLIREITHLRTAFDEYRRTKRHDPALEDRLASQRLVRELGPTGELRLVLAALRSYLSVEDRCPVTARRRRL